MRVFISYSSKDADFVDRLDGDLKSHGIQTWRDKTDIPSHIAANTQGWRRAVDEALRECTHMVLILSPDSVASDEVAAEWNHFLKQEKPVFPIMFRVCDPAARVDMLQTYYFNHDYDIALSQLVTTLKGSTTDENLDITRTSQLVLSATGDGDYTDLNEAMRGLRGRRDNMTLIIRPGIYGTSNWHEIDGSIEIIGDGRPEDVVIEVANDPFLRMVLDSYVVKLTNLTLRYVGTNSTNILLDVWDSKLEINNCHLIGNKHAIWGVRVEGVISPQLCIIQETLINGFEYGVALNRSSRAQIEGCVIKNASEWGITLSDESQATIRSSTFNYCSTGIAATDQSEASVENCTIQFNENGISARGDASVTIEACTITHNNDNAVSGIQNTKLNVFGNDLRNNGKEAIRSGIGNPTIIDRNNLK